MDPRARPFAAGTIERMEELLGCGELPVRSREWVQCVRLLAMGRTAPDVA